MRSAHRYASDAMVLTMLLHLARHFAFDRYRSFRAFSWVSGVFVLWLVTGIPVIGGILKLIAMIWGLGMLVNLKIQAIKRFES